LGINSKQRYEMNLIWIPDTNETNETDVATDIPSDKTGWPILNPDTEIATTPVTTFFKLFVGTPGILHRSFAPVLRELEQLDKNLSEYTVPSLGITFFRRQDGKGRAVWAIPKGDLAILAEKLKIELKSEKEKKKAAPKKTEQDEAKEMFQKLGVLNLVDALGGAEGEIYKIIHILISQVEAEASGYTPEAMEKLLRAHLEGLNLGEGMDGGAGKFGEMDPLAYIRALFELQEKIEKLDVDQKRVFVWAYIRRSFRDLVSNYDGTIAKIKAEIANLPYLKEGDTDSLYSILMTETKRVADWSRVQPEWIKTPMDDYQRFGSMMLRHAPEVTNGRPMTDKSDSAAGARDRVFGFMLADDTRLGKTIQLLGAIMPTWKAAAVVPACVLKTFEEEFNAHVKPGTLKLVVVRGTPEKKEKLLKQYKNTKGVVLLFSMEDIRGWDDERLNLISHGLDVLAVDEAQSIENYSGPGAKSNSDQATVIHEKIKATRKWLFTATPFTSGPHQLFSTFHMFHTNPETRQITDVHFESKRTFKTFLLKGRDALKTIFILFSKISLRRTKDEFPGRFSKKKEFNPSDKGQYTLSLPQSQLILSILKQLTGAGGYLERYNRQVSPDRRHDPDAGGYFLKREFLNWASTDPTVLGEQIEGNGSAFWDSVDKIVRNHLENDEMENFRSSPSDLKPHRLRQER
jgi:hypothetical protein